MTSTRCRGPTPGLRIGCNAPSSSTAGAPAVGGKLGGHTDRRTLIGLAAGAAVIAVLLGGQLISSTGFPLAALVVAPVVTSVFAGVWPTAIMSVTATTVSIAVPPATTGYFSSVHIARCITVAIGGTIAIWLARVRSRHEEEISSTQAVAALADELRGTVAHLDALLERSPAAFAFFDFDGTVRRVNDAFAALFGYEPSDLNGHRIGDAIPHIWDRVRPLFEHVRDTSEPLVDLEVSGTTRASRRSSTTGSPASSR